MNRQEAPGGSRGGSWCLASLLPVLGAVVASAILVVDYARPHPIFCSEGGGCDAVRQLGFTGPFGVPLPVVGLAGFLAIGAAALVGGYRARIVQLVLSAVAGVVGLGLLVEQARLGAFCPYCCMVDACGALTALAAAGWLAFAAEARPPRAIAFAAGGVLPVAAAAPLVIGFRTSPVPPVIRAEMERGGKGEVTIVDFVDFECPFCRRTNAALEPLVEAHRGRVHLVRLQVPLHIHPHALDAARAACCGQQLGRGEDMAAALFSSPVEDLTPAGCEKIAANLGLSVDSFRACVQDPGTSARIEEDRAKFKAAGGHALPTLWIGDTEIIGDQPSEALATAIEGALARAGS